MHLRTIVILRECVDPHIFKGSRTSPVQSHVRATTVNISSRCFFCLFLFHKKKLPNNTDKLTTVHALVLRFQFVTTSHHHPQGVSLSCNITDHVRSICNCTGRPCAHRRAERSLTIELLCLQTVTSIDGRFQHSMQCSSTTHE